MSTVIAAIDIDDAAPAVLQAAHILGRIYDADVEAVHAQLADLPLADLELRDTVQGVPLRTIVGSREDVLAETMNHHDVVAAAIGAHAGGTADRRGRFALRIAALVHVPIVLVPASAPLPRVGLPLRLLVPLDGTDESATTVRALVQRVSAADIDVNIVVLHVFDPGSVPMFLDRPEYDLATWAHEFLSRSRLPRCQVHWKTGSPATEVADAARAEQVDAVVLGWKQSLDPGRSRVVRAMAAIGLPVILVPYLAALGALSNGEASRTEAALRPAAVEDPTKSRV